MIPSEARLRRVAGHIVPPLLFAVLLLTIWQLYVVLGDVKESTLPPPTAVAQTIDQTADWIAERAQVSSP